MFIKTNYLIKEHISLLKLSDTYDITDAETGLQVATAKENISIILKLVRLMIGKKILPTTVEIKETKDGLVMYTMKKDFSFLRSTVRISGKDGNEIGYFKTRILTIGGRFDVFTPNDAKVAEVKGNWVGWNFTFTDTSGNEVGTVSKKWAGIGKEFFTSADNYMISLKAGMESKPEMMALLIMAGLAIDVVYKEKK
jgi:uncharacterized protein YxjI